MKHTVDTTPSLSKFSHKMNDQLYPPIKNVPSETQISKSYVSESIRSKSRPKKQKINPSETRLSNKVSGELFS